MVIKDTRSLGRVLLVDDEHLVRVGARRLLTSRGFDVVEAESAIDALDALDEESFDIVVTDLYMPGAGGLQLASQIKDLHPDLPVVLMTGDTEVELSAHAVAGALIAGLVFKPWDGEEFVGTLCRAMGQASRRVQSDDEAITVLLIEDDDLDARHFVRLVKRSSLTVDKVTQARTLADAVELLQEFTPTVAIVDLSLPDARGLDILRQIKSIEPGLPLIVFTGTDDPTLAVQALQDGVQDYLVKGRVTPDSIGRALRYAIERKRAEERWVYFARHDQTTGLINRAAFRERLGRSIARARRHQKKVGLLFIDLDNFKAVNDTYGHDDGDRVLSLVANALRSAVGPSQIPARLGGDEFAVILSAVHDRSEVLAAAKRVLGAVRRSTSRDSNGIPVEASLGIAMFPDNGENVDRLLRCADAAMYRAKREQLGYSFYSHEMHARASRANQLESELRGALARDEFELCYQPQYELGSTIRRSGVEALLRWRRPVGEVMPGEFIPLLERSALILDVGEWVLREACRQAAEWREGGTEVRVAVNLSARQFRDQRLPEILRSMLTEHQLPPSLLELEITESMFLADTVATRRVLEELTQDVGVRIAIDDFGTGYSSLAYLKRFPIHSLKMDRALVRDIVTDEESAAISEGVIALGHALKLSVVAEGVETQEQLSLLRSQGCDMAQGFYLCEPKVPSNLAIGGRVETNRVSEPASKNTSTAMEAARDARRLTRD